MELHRATISKELPRTALLAGTVTITSSTQTELYPALESPDTNIFCSQLSDLSPKSEGTEKVPLTNLLPYSTLKFTLSFNYLFSSSI